MTDRFSSITEESNKLHCIISLNNTEELVFLLTDLTCLKYYNVDVKKRSTQDTGFTFNTITGKTASYYENSDTESWDEDWIIIENTVEELIHIYQQATQENVDITKCIQFAAVSKYFKSCITEICDQERTHLGDLDFIFIVPNDWSAKTNMVLLVLIPLLESIGVIFQQDPQDKILYVTQLEASLSFLQLNNSEEELEPTPAFVQNANQCIQYDIRTNDDSIQQQSMYFQLKESHDLELFNGGRFYIPEFISIEEDRCLIDFEYVENSLHQLIFGQILDKQLDMENTTAVQDIRDNVLYFIESFVKYNAMPEHSTSNDMGKYISESQIELLFHSEDTIKKILDHLKQLLSNQMQTVLNHIISQNSKVPFFRKSIILNHSIGFTDMYVPWFNRNISLIFVRLLFNELKNKYNDEDPTKFYLMDGDNFYRRSIEGVCLYASMRLMNLNIMLPPVVVKKSNVLNSIGIPAHVSVDQPEEYKFKPDVIAFIDVSLSSTSVTCENISKEGLTRENFSIHIQDINKELSSVLVFLANQYMNSGSNITAYNGDFLNFSEFRESKVAKLMLSANDSKTSPFESKLKTLFHKINQKERIVDKYSSISNVQTNFAKYLKEVVNVVDLYLSDKGVQIGNVGYVLCVEKLVLNNLHMGSRKELSKFIKESKCLVESHRRNMVVVDQGEKEVYSMLPRSRLKPPSFYVHANIEDSYIYLKLHQIVDTTSFCDEIDQHSTVLVKEKMVMIETIQNQVCERLWNHIQSLDELENDDFIGLCTSNLMETFESFKKVLTSFIKENLLFSSNIDIDHKHTIRISSGTTIAITSQQILRFAIIPVLQELFSTVIFSLTNNDVFGYYEITKLFITGSFFKLKSYNEVYHYTIVTEAKKMCEHLIRETTYRTTLDICISTSNESCPSRNVPMENLEKKCFCYDVFLKGELCIVSSSTYFLYLPKIRANEYWTSVEIDSAIKCGFSSSLMLRGEELRNKTIQLKSSRQGFNHYPVTVYARATFHKYNESHGKTGTKTSGYDHSVLIAFPGTIMQNILIEVLHYSSSIKITFEPFVKSDGKLIYFKIEYFLSERFTLKYF